MPRGLRELTILSCLGDPSSTLGWRADDRAPPVALDPCIGAGAGSRLHFHGTSELDARGGGDLERAAYDLVIKAIGRGEHAHAASAGGGVPLEIAEATASRIAWTSGWDKAAAALPKPVLLDAAKQHSAGTEGEGGHNGWLFSRDAHVVRGMAVNNRGGRLQWSKEASYWLRQNHLSPGDPLPARAGCLAAAGASVHVRMSDCRAQGARGPHGGITEEGGEEEEDCRIDVEHSIFFRAAQRCPPRMLAQEARRSGAPHVRILLAKGLDTGTWISDDLDEHYTSDTHNVRLDVSFDLQERAPFQAQLVVRRAVGSGFHRLVQTRLVLVPLGFGRRGVEGAEDCEMVMLEVLPHEVFVDPFELAEAANFGGNVTRVVSQHAVDLEVLMSFRGGLGGLGQASLGLGFAGTTPHQTDKLNLQTECL